MTGMGDVDGGELAGMEKDEVDPVKQEADGNGLQ
jgi:hypothetical protein